MTVKSQSDFLFLALQSMLPTRIKEGLEQSKIIRDYLSSLGIENNWDKFNRTVFDGIARRINRAVTAKVIGDPKLVHNYMVLGEDQLQSLLFERKLNDAEALIKSFENNSRLFNWVSGKTLHSYWNHGKPKDRKLNVLLAFLGVKISEWDEWRNVTDTSTYLKGSSGKNQSRKNNNQELIRKYFLGSYYLYYQKSDNSAALVKAPFTIAVDSHGNIFSETVTEGHLYRSNLIELRDGILYIHCENLVFDEKENHIFNVGNETNPEVLFGISNTISVKSKMAIGIRNVLVRQKKNFSKETFTEKEILFDQKLKDDSEEAIVLNYFLKQRPNLIISDHCCTLEVLKIK